LIFFFDSSHRYTSILAIIIGGFFLDLFSDVNFGVSILSLLIVYVFVKELLRVLRGIPRKYLVFYFMPIFVFCVILYDFLFGAFSLLFDRSTIISFGGYALGIKILFNLCFAIPSFYIFKKIADAKTCKSKGIR